MPAYWLVTRNKRSITASTFWALCFLYMPEFYTFITEATKQPLDEIIEGLKDEQFDYAISESERGKIISGSGFTTDCGYPLELMYVFAASGVRCVYCNNNEYGMIDGAKDMKLTNSTLQE